VGGHRPDYYRYAIDAENSPELEIRNFAGNAAHPDRFSARLGR